jgi:gliding motility-associated-like protein
MFRWEAALGICTGADSLILSFHEQPVADAGPDQVLEYKFSTSLEATLPDEGEGQWSVENGTGHFSRPTDPLSTVNQLSLGENVFQWTVSSEYCPDVSDLVRIVVNDVQTYTVITPNNDGLNDFLVFPGVEDIRGCEIIIFNRWGIEVYRNENYQNNWDGRDHKDRDLIQDTYYYILRIPPDRVIKNFVEIRRNP